jgi:hypothetical protein
MTTALARRYRADVSKDGINWVQIMGMNDFNPAIDRTTQDSSDYESDGWGSSEITMQAWSVDIKANRKTNSGVFDPGQELCRLASDKFGEDARLYVRWYDKNGGTEAYQGRGIVEFSRSKTGVTDLDEAEIKITGDGARKEIPNPLSSTSAPAITAISPASVKVGALLQLTGSGFTGATAVDFGSTAATVYTVVSDGLIVATVPDAVGTQSVTVTTPAGTSTGTNVTIAAA